MNVTILDVQQGTDFNGEVNYTMVVLGKFKEFKTITPASQKVELSFEQYNKYKDMVGKQANLDLVIPVSKYPFSLAT
jgi:hypothetical protein